MAAVVAIAAALGIALPGGDDSTSTTSRAAPSAQATTATGTGASSTPASSATAPTGGSPSGGVSSAGPSPDSEEGQAIARVLAQIDSGQRSQYSQDGGTFENREGLLPAGGYGYYREYTVLTPNSPDRGARRLVRGEQGELYYTSDHYASFTRIDPGRYR